MQVVRTGLVVAALALPLACGARTGLLPGSEGDLPGGFAGTDFSSSGSGGKSGGGFGGGGKSFGGGGLGGAGSGGKPPLTTRCELEGDDPRVAGIEPDEIARLDGADFVVGDVQSYHWSLQAEDCDAVVQNAQFVLQDANSQVAKFQPSRPSIYHFTLEAVDFNGQQVSCNLAVPVMGVGMRVELCWDTSTTTDLDLYLHDPRNQEPWFIPGSFDINEGLNGTTCNTSNCTANLRDQPRVSWGYPDSDLSACNTPSFDGFLNIGACFNPRAADDNNQDIATGTTERMQLDNPRNGEQFRVMAQNFSNSPARPHVFVYCGGERAGAFEAPMDLPDFVSSQPGAYGVMWRAADVTTSVDGFGNVSCSAAPVGAGALTVDDSQF
jgi:hypothetical protein